MPCLRGDQQAAISLRKAGRAMVWPPRFMIPERSAMSLSDEKAPLSPQQIQQIQRLAEQLSFGSISLVFQNGKLIQIDKNEKFRLDK